MPKKILKTEKDTIEFAKDFAKSLKGGEILSLEGDLGAGKTVFAKGIAKGLGIKKIIKSPTFVLMRVYPLPLPRLRKAGINKNINNLVHVDAYRVNDYKELENIGLEEYFDNKNIIAIEWGDKFLKNYPIKVKRIKFEIKDKQRIITF